MGWPGDRRAICPGCREAGWTGGQYRLSKNKGVFDAELDALYQIIEILGGRNEQGQECTVLSDSTVAIGRAGYKWLRIHLITPIHFKPHLHVAPTTVMYIVVIYQSSKGARKKDPPSTSFRIDKKKKKA